MNIFADLRVALRRMLQQPGYASAVIVTLALAIGANTAVFSAVHAVLLKPLGIEAPADLIVVWGAEPARSLPVVELSYRQVEHWAARSEGLTHLAAMGASTWTMVLDGQGEAVRLSHSGVTASFFETLGARPFLGRTFRADDDMPHAPRVVVLNHDTWVRRFGSRDDIVGTSIHFNDEPYTVIGVMSPGFSFPRGAEFWTPITPILAASSERWKTDAFANAGVLFAIGRLREGVAPETALAELDQLAARLQQTTKAPRFGTAVVVTPLVDYLHGPVRPALWLLFGAVGVLLLIACANVSGLLLTRASLRRREHAIQLAIGASRMTVARLWIVETVLLSLLGGVAGLLAASWIAGAIAALAPGNIPALADVAISIPVAAFTFATTLAAALLCGVGPVRQASRAVLLDALKDEARSTSGRATRRVHSMLLTLQVALAVVLLIAAGLVVRSFVKLQAIDLGFVPSHVLTMNVSPRTAAATNDWFDEVVRRVSTLPQVEAAGAIYLPPLAIGPIGLETWVVLEGQPGATETRWRNPTLNYQVATPGYFDVMRIGLRNGRLFDARDDHRSPRVALVSEGAARRLWPGENAVGKRLAMPSFTPRDSQMVWRTVVGVVADVRYRGIHDVRLDVYDAALQAPPVADDLVIRTTGDPFAVAGAVQATARELDPRVVIDRIASMRDVVDAAVAPWRLTAWMLTAFAVLAFVLAAFGLFSLVSLDAANRQREFAVRIALGGSRRHILRLAMTTPAMWAAAGLVVGFVVAAVATRVLGGLLFGVELLDPVTYSLVIAVVVGVVMLAAYIPARRAADVTPMALLRRE